MYTGFKITALTSILLVVGLPFSYDVNQKAFKYRITNVHAGSSLSSPVNTHKKEDDHLKAASPDFSGFKQTELVRAFYLSDLDSAEKQHIASLLYISEVNESLSETNFLIRADGSSSILLEVDVKLPTLILRELSTLSEYWKLSSEYILACRSSAIVSHRRRSPEEKARYEEFNERISALIDKTPSDRVENNSCTNHIIAIIKRHAKQDALKLIVLYDTNSIAFRKIYSGMKTYVYGL